MKAPVDMTVPEAAPATGAALADRLARAITLAGPVSIAQFMAAANGHYYATRDPLGAQGDFVTAPEISQMFGELIGAWAADLSGRARACPAYVELGPGRGSLAEDALRVMARAGLVPDVHLVETSSVLRAAQAQKLPMAQWHDTVATLPEDGPLLLVANEFFDALPIRQLVRGGQGWHERLVACQDVLFVPIAGEPVPGAIIPAALGDAPLGSIIETSPASVAIMRALAHRLVVQGGAMLLIDYGYEGPAIGDTLQAVRAHGYANPFDAPGEQDLSAHVDFATLAHAATEEGARVYGPVSQGAFLTALGIEARARALGSAAKLDRDRLIDAAQMGCLFKVLAITAPDWPEPAGFVP